MPDPTQGQPEPQSAQDASLTEAQLSQVAELVNKAISSRNKSSEKKFEEFQLALTKKLDESFAAFQAAPPPAPVTADGKPKGDAHSPELNAMKKQLAEVQAKMAEAEKATAAAIAAKRDQELRARASELLQASGADPKATKYALALLIDSEKRIGYDEEGAPVFKDQTGDLPMEAGIKSWLKSDEAKAILPARGVQGSGARQVGTPVRNGAAGASPDDQMASILQKVFSGEVR